MTDRAWTVDRLVRGWWSYHELSREREGLKRIEQGEGAAAVEAAAAWEAVEMAVRQGGPSAVELVQAVIRSAPTDGPLADIGHWPLDALITTHGVELAATIAETASQDQRFADALGRAWILDRTLDEASHRLLGPYINPAVTAAPPPQPGRKARWKDRRAPGTGPGPGDRAH